MRTTVSGPTEGMRGWGGRGGVRDTPVTTRTTETSKNAQELEKEVEGEGEEVREEDPEITEDTGPRGVIPMDGEGEEEGEEEEENQEEMEGTEDVVKRKRVRADQSTSPPQQSLRKKQNQLPSN